MWKLYWINEIVVVVVHENAESKNIISVVLT